MIKLITAPDTTPISVANVKTFARLDSDVSDESIISLLIESAVDKTEQYIDRALITQTWRLSMDGAPCSDYVDLPKGPIQSATVKYYTDDNTENTFSSDNYFVDVIGGRLVLNKGYEWPISSGLRARNSIQIDCVCGYGDSATDVPAAIRQGLFELVTHMYDNRESQDIPPGARRLFDKYRVWAI